MDFYLLLSAFRKKTYNALLTQSGISSHNDYTAIFMNKILTRGKSLNVKTLQIDLQHNDPL